MLLEDFLQSTTSRISCHCFMKRPFVMRRIWVTSVFLIKSGADEGFEIEPSTDVNAKIGSYVRNWTWSRD
jgi:hypothetical protein